MEFKEHYALLSPEDRAKTGLPERIPYNEDVIEMQERVARIKHNIHLVLQGYGDPDPTERAVRLGSLKRIENKEELLKQIANEKVIPQLPNEVAGNIEGIEE